MDRVQFIAALLEFAYHSLDDKVYNLEAWDLMDRQALIDLQDKIGRDYWSRTDEIDWEEEARKILKD